MLDLRAEIKNTPNLEIDISLAYSRFKLILINLRNYSESNRSQSEKINLRDSG
jgi:hypothetical protein